MTVSRNIVKTRKWFVASARRKRRRRRGQGQGHCILPQIPVFPANFPSEGSTNSRGTQNCKASIATHLCGRVPAAETELHRKLLHTVRDASSSLQLFLFAFTDCTSIQLASLTWRIRLGRLSISTLRPQTNPQAGSRLQGEDDFGIVCVGIASSNVLTQSSNSLTPRQYELGNIFTQPLTCANFGV